ncbi:hypothetical protein QVD17_23617 [Tagetes erecta]|uniref:PRA1 family protein n=1 Tax=Tagetes erecta TaxID=13708 RepID=A0AAD8NU94_TARER|nr:hypothetical protein QVD17_23617 [Tagetes erecta]
MSSLPTTTTQTPSTATPAFRSFISRFSSTIRHSFSNRRPWSELIDRSAFARPESLSDAASRIRKNFIYFRVNYISLFTIVLAISLLTHPFSLIILLSLLCAWLFLYLFRSSDQPLVLFGRNFSDRETLLMLIVLTIVAVMLTEIGSVVISAVLVGLGIVCVHGAFRVPEEAFFDDQEQNNNAGLLSFLGGTGSSTVTGV